MKLKIVLISTGLAVLIIVVWAFFYSTRPFYRSRPIDFYYVAGHIKELEASKEVREMDVEIKDFYIGFDDRPTLTWRQRIDRFFHHKSSGSWYYAIGPAAETNKANFIDLAIPNEVPEHSLYKGTKIKLFFRGDSVTYGRNIAYGLKAVDVIVLYRPDRYR